MNKKIVFVFVIIMGCMLSCKKDNPCDSLVNGIYQFPELPENHGMMTQEIFDFRDLPRDIANCITTEGLIETCLNYPELRMIMVGANPQAGFNSFVYVNFLGVRELESRPDRGTCLLRKYQTMDPLGYDPNWEAIEKGQYNFNIYNFHIIFGQYANLQILTKAEEIELIEAAIIMYDKMISDLDNYSFYGLECITTLMGRLMFLNNFSPLVKAYNDNQHIKELLDFYGPVNPQTVEYVYNISKEYLNYLKNN